MIKELDQTFYEIQVKGHLDAGWIELFDGMNIIGHDNVTTISGMVADRLRCTACWRASAITGLR